MNFKNSYSSDINNITPDKYIKEKVRDSLIPDKPVRLRRSAIYRAATAVITCLVLICSVSVIKNKDNIKKHSSEPVKSISNYDDIYSAVKKFTPSFGDVISKTYNSIMRSKSNSADGIPMTEGSVEESQDKSAGIGENKSNHSETTTQVDGVDEADIVKTDGNYIYALSSLSDSTKINIFEIKNKTPRKISDININKISINEIYLYKNRLVLIGLNSYNKSSACIYDIKNPSNPVLIDNCVQSGNYSNSRLIGNKLYLLSNFDLITEKIKKSDTSSYIPSINCSNYNETVKADTINLCNNVEYPRYTVISCYNIDDASLCSTQSILGGTFTVYCSTDNIITASDGYDNKTDITRFSIKDGKIELKAGAEISGSLLNQFSIDEYKNHFRFVTTQYNGKETVNGKYVSYEQHTKNSLVILDENLKQTGKIDNIAPEEKVYSVRFMGDTAYFVTFRQVDPLFSVDVSNPTTPKIIGQLKIPGFSDYLFPYGKGKLLGIGQNADEKSGRTSGMKLSLFDITNPSNVSEGSKTDVNAMYSEALYNHKACLVDYNKNIIAFSAYDNIEYKYFIYTLNNDSFKLLADISIPGQFEYVRGLYIGDTFYIITNSSIYYYDISNISKLGEISF